MILGCFLGIRNLDDFGYGKILKICTNWNFGIQRSVRYFWVGPADCVGLLGVTKGGAFASKALNLEPGIPGLENLGLGKILQETVSRV